LETVASTSFCGGMPSLLRAMYLEFGRRLIISLNLGLTISLYSSNYSIIRSLSSFLLLNKF
jgi:hypothetical protein